MEARLVKESFDWADELRLLRRLEAHNISGLGEIVWWTNSWSGRTQHNLLRNGLD